MMPQKVWILFVYFATWFLFAVLEVNTLFLFPEAAILLVYTRNLGRYYRNRPESRSLAQTARIAGSWDETPGAVTKSLFVIFLYYLILSPIPSDISVVGFTVTLHLKRKNIWEMVVWLAGSSKWLSLCFGKKENGCKEIVHFWVVEGRDSTNYILHSFHTFQNLPCLNFFLGVNTFIVKQLDFVWFRENTVLFTFEQRENSRGIELITKEWMRSHKLQIRFVIKLKI